MKPQAMQCIINSKTVLVVTMSLLYLPIASSYIATAHSYQLASNYK